MISQFFLPLSLAFIMFALGLSLVFNDFKQVILNPRAIALGLFCQMLLLPLLAFALITSWRMSPELAVGIMILAACPGGITSNLLTHLAKGDSALSVSLTAITSLAGIITIPLIVNFALIHFTGNGEPVELPVWKMIRGVFVITTLPVLLGMIVRRYFPKSADRIEKHAHRVATALFIVIVFGGFASQWGSMTRHFSEAGPVALALNILTMLSGFFGARLLYLKHRQKIAITIECGLQNGALGIFVASTLLVNQTMMIPSLIYALIMNLTVAIFMAASFLPRPIREA